MTHINDLHCQVSSTQIQSLIEVRDAADIRAAILRCREDGGQVSIAGGRHALGRQALKTNGLVLDMRPFNQILGLNESTGELRMQGGAQWTDIRNFLEGFPCDMGQAWEIRQKQTGADAMSIAGAIAVNAHGNSLDCGPIAGDIRWIKLITCDGEEVFCSRETNPELFSLAIGGFGLFGVISEICLQLVPKQLFLRRSKVCRVDRLLDALDRLRCDYQYADMQLETDPASDNFLKRGVLNLWKAAPKMPPTSPAPQTLSSGDVSRVADWGRLVALAHYDKAAAFTEYSQFAESVDGSLVARSSFQWDSYTPGYHHQIEQALELPPGGELLAEFFVPPNHLAEAIEHIRHFAYVYDIDLILTTLRFIRACTNSFLRWAKSDYVCIVMAMHTNFPRNASTSPGLHAVDSFCAQLAAFFSKVGGSFYLPYRPFAQARDLQLAYPNVRDFLDLQGKYDPHALFGSDWSQWLKRVLEHQPLKLATPG